MAQPRGEIMPAADDIYDILETLVLTNLNNLVQPIPTLVVPVGLQYLVTTEALENFGNLGLPKDVQDIVDTTIAIGRVHIVVVS